VGLANIYFVTKAHYNMQLLQHKTMYSILLFLTTETIPVWRIYN